MGGFSRAVFDCGVLSRKWRREGVLLGFLQSEDQGGKIGRIETSGVLPLACLAVLVTTRSNRDGAKLLRSVVGIGSVEPNGDTDAAGKRADLLFWVPRLTTALVDARKAQLIDALHGGIKGTFCLVQCVQTS